MPHMSDTGTTASYVVTVAIAIISGGGLNWILTYRQRKKIEAQDERDRKKREEKEKTDRRENDRRETELLAEAQAVSQRTALASEAKRYGTLEKDYQACRNGLEKLSQATSSMIDAFEKIMIRLHPHGEDDMTYVAELTVNEIGEVRRSINAARRHLR